LSDRLVDDRDLVWKAELGWLAIPIQPTIKVCGVAMDENENIIVD
jgi:hypothetical protein